ncbi:MAG: hypothetical protein FJY97_20975 [candidate division Zixibacteria bacterium]|nr:hypothetical protein [candidate division Zixibacteria bacterium]
MATPRIFKTDKRLKLGIWGLGRGLSFFRTCEALSIDVVAGCDFNRHMRDRFAELQPEAYVTDDAEKFLAQDFDAVLLATYCPAHADDAIRCLNARKHVLSEVTSFHTMAEGVRLVEAVEAGGKVYNLAENYPFSAANMWLARKWREGLFGDLSYAEYEYVHECRVLAYTYIDGEPIQPGNQAHSWRSWLNFHYYNTHSLGPMMHITGLRPTRTTALPSTTTLAGYILNAREGMGGIAPSLINMSNGAVVRNLMGATTNDTHQQRIWGTFGSARAAPRPNTPSSRIGTNSENWPKKPATAAATSGRSTTLHGKSSKANPHFLTYTAQQTAPFPVSRHTARRSTTAHRTRYPTSAIQRHVTPTGTTTSPNLVSIIVRGFFPKNRTARLPNNFHSRCVI